MDFLGEILGEKKTIQKRKYYRANISVRKKDTYTLLDTIISTQCNYNIEEYKTEASKHHFKIVINGTIDSIVIA